MSVSESDVQRRFGQRTAFFNVQQASTRYPSCYATPTAIVQGDGVVFSKGTLVRVENMTVLNCATGTTERHQSGPAFLKLADLQRIDEH